MGYNLYITRKKNDTDDTGPDITADPRMVGIGCVPLVRADAVRAFGKRAHAVCPYYMLCLSLRLCVLA